MRKNNIRLEMLAGDLESRFGPDDFFVIDVRQELAKRRVATSRLSPKFPAELRSKKPSSRVVAMVTKSMLTS
jgi:hypothetical protein